MVDVKSILAIAISIAILAFVVDRFPTIKNNIDGMLSGVSLPNPGVRASSSFPVNLDTGSLTSSFTIKVENAGSVTASSENVSIIFDDRQIAINPSKLEDVKFESYSGKLSYDSSAKVVGFDGSANGIISDYATIKSERSVKVLGNLTSGTTELSNVVGGTVTINKATGNLVYNSTNSISLLDEDVKVGGFKGKISIGSYGLKLEGTAGYLEVKGDGKTVTYG
ncbi:MAG: hypothetical protein HY051_04835 [Candidatus Aenigmarchaeota archaeon]|nr:hypothetical protein [Candidatus Aenigmarchaeota archaeon]